MLPKSAQRDEIAQPRQRSYEGSSVNTASPPDHLANLIEEYRVLVGELENADNVLALQRKLVKDAEWTDRGAEAVVFLARYYGSFLLSNALALAEVLDVEDGECGL